jgi:hypothetical protein
MAEVGCLKDGAFQNLQIGMLLGGGMVPGLPIVLGPANNVPSNGSTLTKNTYYGDPSASGSGYTFLLPTQANSVAGDWIFVRDTNGFSGSSEHIKIGSAANGSFATGCHIHGINATATATSEAVAISESTHNSVIMQGQNDGAGAAGSWVAFVFNGTQWTVTGEMRNIGNGSVPVCGVAGFRFSATP